MRSHWGRRADVSRGPGTAPERSSPRYQLYPTKDGRLVLAALEQNSGMLSCRRSRCRLILPMTAETHSGRGAQLQTLSARAPPRSGGRFRQSRLLRHDRYAARRSHPRSALSTAWLVRAFLESRGGGTMPALPLPVAPQFRGAPAKKKAPPLAKALRRASDAAVQSGAPHLRA